MTLLRLRTVILLGLLLLAAFLLVPKPLSGQAITKSPGGETTTTGPILLTEKPVLTTTTDSLSTSGQSRTPSIDPLTTGPLSSIHNTPGHQCERCRDTENLPPWRRRLIEKSTEARQKELQ